MTVYYIHGYGSSVNSETLQKLRKSFPDAIGLTYDPLDPNGSILRLALQLQKDNDDHVVVVSSSLGGWYAEQLTKHIIADYIFYNPCTEPEKSLAKYSVPEEILEKYRSMKTECSPASRTVIVSVDDTVILPAIADNKYKNIANMIYTAGGHRITTEALNAIVKQIKFLFNQLP